MNQSTPTLSESMSLYRKLQNETKDKQVKIAVLSSFTLKGLKETLFVQLHKLGVFADFYFCDYNQYAQEILDPQSKLYKFKPDIVFLFIDTRNLMGDNYFLPYDISHNNRKKWTKNKLLELGNLIDMLASKLSTKIIVHNFSIPTYSPLSILENKQLFGSHESVEKLNFELRKKYKKNSQVYIFDYDSFCSKLGKDNTVDHSMYYIGDIQINFDTIPKLGRAYLGYIKPLVSLTKKCIVLDLDNTLWGGVVGEDGLSGIKIGPTPDGRPYWEFQKRLLALFNRGVILAINSKNNDSDVQEIFKKHPHMVLKEKHFAAMQINWNDKVSNLKALATELNIGLDTFVFFDDDKLNRELVRTQLPEVTVVELPPNPAVFSKTLEELDEFNSLELTDEDLQKGKMYAKQRERQLFEKSVTNLDDFLMGMKIVVSIEKANEFNIPRIAQLTQKTNQFNLTTRRYQQEEIRTFAMSGDLIAAIKVSDKFGDNGLTGLAIIKKEKDEWQIDSFLLSCRVIGRRVEETLLAYIINQAKKEGAKRIMGKFIPTKKNELVRDFFEKNNFYQGTEENTWVYDTSKPYPIPKLIKLVDLTSD